MTSHLKYGVFILLVGIGLSGCAGETALTPGELNVDAAQYDGKQVRVRAWLVYQFENIGLWESQKAYETAAGPDADRNLFSQRAAMACVSYEGPDLGRNYASRMVTLTGTFQKDLYHDPKNPDSVIISNGWCNKTGVIIDR